MEEVPWERGAQGPPLLREGESFLDTMAASCVWEDEYVLTGKGKRGRGNSRWEVTAV